MWLSLLHDLPAQIHGPFLPEKGVCLFPESFVLQIMILQRMGLSQYVGYQAPWWGFRGWALTWRAAQMGFFSSRLATGYVDPIPLPSPCLKIREVALTGGFLIHRWTGLTMKGIKRWGFRDMGKVGGKS